MDPSQKHNSEKNYETEKRILWAVGGKMWRNDDKISATTSSTYSTRTKHGPSEGDNVGIHRPPREPFGAHGEVHARAKIQRVGGS